MELDVLISKEEIRDKISSVAQVLNQRYHGQEVVLVAVMKGALCLVSDLLRELTVPCTLELIQASSYGQRGSEKGELRVSGLDEFELVGKNALVIDDIFDSGQTLSHVMSKIKEKQPRTAASLVLLSKKIRRQFGYQPDYVLFEIDDHFVVGYGLDYKEYYRGLPAVCIWR